MDSQQWQPIVGFLDLSSRIDDGSTQSVSTAIKKEAIVMPKIIGWPLTAENAGVLITMDTEQETSARKFVILYE